jgi:hypothetical protein
VDDSPVIDHPIVPVRPPADHGSPDHEGPVKIPPAPIAGGAGPGGGAQPVIDETPVVPVPPGAVAGIPKKESDADRGSDFDTVPEISPPPLSQEDTAFSVPNLAFESARILINPRCVTTYAGVSHTKLANDLFGVDGDWEDSPERGEYNRRNYVLEEWGAAPASYVCQEQRYVRHPP